MNALLRAAFVDAMRPAPADAQAAAAHTLDRPAPRSPAWTRLAGALWQRRAIRSQLLIIVTLLAIMAALVAGAVTILVARTSTRVEIEASTKVAQLLVNETVQLVRDDTPARALLESLPLQLRFLRHVRISVRDAADVPVAGVTAAGAPDPSAEVNRAPAPAWFQALIAPPIESHVVPIVATGRRIGSILIVSEPSDEIAEVWESTRALGLVALAVTVAMIAALHALFGRALAPLTAIGRGLGDLEQQNYKVRLPAPQTREFLLLTARFNALAETLEAVRAENARLGHRLITAQDDERKHTALELHDEVGPSLFGLKASATSIARVVADQPDAVRGKTIERVQDMLAVIEHLQAVNRGMLNRLRPMALGHVPLEELVAQIVRDRAREYADIGFSFAATGLARSYGDSIDLTIYRCIQESLTNAIRHAQARSIAVTLSGTHGRDGSTAGALSRIELTVHDDGCGIATDAPRGFGLHGMAERVRALGGEFSVAARGEGGTSVRVAISPEELPGGDESEADEPGYPP